MSRDELHFGTDKWFYTKMSCLSVRSKPEQIGKEWENLVSNQMPEWECLHSKSFSQIFLAKKYADNKYKLGDSDSN